MPRFIFKLLFSVVCFAAMGCGLTVTKERPDFAQLSPVEKSAVEVILAELAAFNAQVEQRTTLSIATIVQREKIDVSFEGLITAANFGDELVHVSTWENLTEVQQQLFQTWFGKSDLVKTRATYHVFFYQLMAVSQGVKQFMYEALTPAWVFANRSLFNVEKDSLRTAMAHYAGIKKQPQIMAEVGPACSAVIGQLASEYDSKFSKEYLAANYREMADPDNPRGYMYFLCRWVENAINDAEGLSAELKWLQELAL